VKARSDRIAAREESSSPDSVNDSRNGEAPTVAISKPHAKAVILRPSRSATSIVVTTANAATSAAMPRMTFGEPPR
jgi:hypothetical protein